MMSNSNDDSSPGLADSQPFSAPASTVEMNSDLLDQVRRLAPQKTKKTPARDRILDELMSDDPDEVNTSNFEVPNQLLDRLQPNMPLHGTAIHARTLEIEMQPLDEYVLERIEDDDEDSPQTLVESRAINAAVRLEFVAEVDDNGNICPPEDMIKDGRIRPGMRFRIVAYPR